MRAEVTTFFEEVLGVEIPDDQTDLLEAGLLDSLGFVELLAHIEIEWGVLIDVETLDFEQFSSVAAIAATVHGQLESPRSEAATP